MCSSDLLALVERHRAYQQVQFFAADNFRCRTLHLLRCQMRQQVGHTEYRITGIFPDVYLYRSTDSLYTAWVGSNFKLEGQKACEWLKQYAAAKNMSEVNIVDIQGTIGASAQIGRTEALNEAVEANGWNLLAQQTGEFTQARGQIGRAHV